MEEKSYLHLYDDSDKKILKDAEDSLDPKIDRVDEIIEYCHHTGITDVGIANCVAFERETINLKKKLSENGITVSSANCKLGKIPFNDLVPNYKGLSCNPAGQANYLAEQKTELNITVGLCLGHDMIFNKKSEALVTPLIVKDRKMKANSYFNKN